MEVAITGASGFVGATLVRRHRERGDGVRVLVRDPGAAVCRLPGVRVFEADLSAPAALPEDFAAGADVLYHCAAEFREERLMMAVNVEGTRALARVAAGRVRRWVQVSSASVYGAVRCGDITEDGPIAPDSLYGRTKVEAESIARDAAGGGCEVVILRPSNIVGPGMPGTSVHRLLELIERGLFCFVGEPRATMNYIPVDSVAAALVLCGTHERAAGRVYNVSDDLPIERLVEILAGEIGARRAPPRLPELPLRMMATALGWIPGVPLTHRNLDAVTGRARYACERIRLELGYAPAVGVEAALRELAREWKRSRRRA